MTPTFIFRAGKPFLLTGSPGGSRIISTVLQVIINVLDYNFNVAEAVARPRMHHQWLPDILSLEPGFSQDTIDILKLKGQNIGRSRTMGSANSILIQNGIFFGAADPRWPDARAVAPKISPPKQPST
jgi:gamma-glutamyltranspeptidase/glutathione hydrolase